MLTEEEINEKIRLATIITDEDKDDFTIEECLKFLPTESLEVLYSRYDISEQYDYIPHHSKKKTKSQKIKYIASEIPGQFLDDYRFMMNKSSQEKIKRLCQGKKLKIDYDIIDLAYFGFVYFREKNNEIEIIFPYDLGYFVEAFLLQ